MYTYNKNSLQENASIIDSATSWNTLLMKESLQIKLKKVLSSGLKVSKELQLWDPLLA